MEVAQQISLTQEQRTDILDALLGGAQSKVIPFGPSGGDGQISVENTGDGYRIIERREDTGGPDSNGMTITDSFQLDSSGSYTDCSSVRIHEQSEVPEDGVRSLNAADGDELLARLAN